MRARHHVALVSVGLVLALSASACLGEDYKTLELSLSEWDHHWLVTVEPDEDFVVGLRANPLFPEAEWRLVTADAAVIELEGTEYDPWPFGNPADVGEDEAVGIPDVQVGVQMFRLRGLDEGSTPVAFELAVDGRRIDIAEYEVAVVADACEGEVGLAAARCRRGVEGHDVGFTEWEHGQTIDLSVGEPIEIALMGNALYPDDGWQLVSFDSGVAAATSATVTPARADRNWDTGDTSESARFVPVSEFVLEARAPGETTLRFEIVVGGEPIEVCEFTLRVAV